jgi:threonine dehydratase
MHPLSLEALEQAAAVVHAVLAPTPQFTWPLLNQRLGLEVWVKHENHAPVGAFKLRGGLVYMDALVRRQPEVKAVVSATRGNHGQSIAFAAQRHGLRAVIVVPHGNSPSKNAAMRARSAELVEHGDDFQAALEHAVALAESRRLHFVPSFHEALVRGVASYSLELFRAVPDLHTLYVPIGLGSGVCGAIAVRDALNAKTEIVGVVAEAAPAYALSFAARRPVSAPVGNTIADGVACRTPNAEALEIILRGVARVVAVSEAEIRQAMCHLFTDAHQVAEGAGAAALAAATKERSRLQGRRVAVVQTGGNIDPAVFASVLAEPDVQ